MWLFAIPLLPVVHARGTVHVAPLKPVPAQSHAQLPVLPVAAPPFWQTMNLLGRPCGIHARCHSLSATRQA